VGVPVDQTADVNQTAEWLYQEFRQSTQASPAHCRTIADRLGEEVDRICTESHRIQASGEVETWAMNLARHRLQQCLKYYRLGSRHGRIELHSTLSAVIYRYIARQGNHASYQQRLLLIEDFLQGFYIESLNALRREANLASDYQPRSLLELAEYMAFTERYAKRRINLPRSRSQQLIILRAQTFANQQPQESLVDLDQAADGILPEEGDSRTLAPLQRVREQMVSQDQEMGDDSLRQKVIDEVLTYLKERKQEDCADYFRLRLLDLPTSDIEKALGLTPRQRDYLQQRFKYHLLRFSLNHRWELVHQWLESDIDHCLGLLPQEWEQFQTQLTEIQQQILQLKRQHLPEKEIANLAGCTLNQVQRQWAKMLETAWEIRNQHLESSS
jgi:hypothetical protein